MLPETPRSCAEYLCARNQCWRARSHYVFNARTLYVPVEEECASRCPRAHTPTHRRHTHARTRRHTCAHDRTNKDAQSCRIITQLDRRSSHGRSLSLSLSVCLSLSLYCVCIRAQEMKREGGRAGETENVLCMDLIGRNDGLSACADGITF